MNDEELPDFYALLGIDPTASEEEIKQAYRAEIKLWHPDRNMARPKWVQEHAKRVSSQLNQAIACLLDARKRPSYDEWYRDFVAYQSDSEVWERETHLSPRNERTTDEDAPRADRKKSESSTGEGQFRSVVFPKDLALGTLFLAKELSGSGDWLPRIAQGIVQVPVGHYAVLKLRRDRVTQDAVERLQVQGVDGLCFDDSAWANSIVVKASLCLGSHNHLKYLDASNTGVSDRGVARLSTLPSLQFLDLSGTKITTNGLRQLAVLTELSELSLAGIPIQDSAVTQLSAIRSLRKLVLRRTQLSDQAVNRLAELPNLHYLDLSGTPLLRRTVDLLMASMPSCAIIW